MIGRTSAVWKRAGAVLGTIVLLGLPIGAQAATPELKGNFELLKNEPSTHQRGKVKIVEFADFYCPHCHHFEEAGLPLLVKEFGDKIEVTMVGFPVIPGKLPTAFDMYEQAKTMGKGDEIGRAHV